MSHMLRRQDHCFQISFIKGMTLEHYMAGLIFISRQEDANTLQKLQQDLYESSGNPQDKPCLGKKRQNMTKGNSQKNKDLLKRSQKVGKGDQKDEILEQLTKATFTELKQIRETRPGSKSKTLKNSTTYLGKSSNQRSDFRIKHFSNSPVKKTKQSKLSNSQMTPQSVKSSKQNQKKLNPVNQLIIFQDQLTQIQRSFFKEAQLKTLQTKGSMIKKNSLNIYQLNQVQNRIKHATSNKVFLGELRVQGLKEKLVSQKSK